MSDSRYRDSGDGRFITKEDAQKRPPNTVEKERIKPSPKPSNPSKGKK
jgi:hypothetical protein